MRSLQEKENDKLKSFRNINRLLNKLSVSKSRNILKMNLLQEWFTLEKKNNVCHRISQDKEEKSYHLSRHRKSSTSVDDNI